MTEVVIRAPRVEEYERIGELTAAAFVDGGSPADGPYADQLRDVRGRADHCELLVAVDQLGAAAETILGAVCFVTPDSPLAEVCHAGEAEFRMLAVDPAAQGRGAGEALARACLQRAREGGFAAVAISTAERSSAARHLYTKLGFVRIPERDREVQRGPKLLAFRIELD